MRLARSIAKIAACGLLTLGNLLVLLPREWTIYQFLPIHGRSASLHLALHAEHQGVFHLIADFDELAQHAGFAVPMPGLQRLLERRRIRTVVQSSRIVLTAHSTNSDQYWRSAELPSADHWLPNYRPGVHFMFNNPFELPPGEYEIQALFFAHPPQGVAQDSGISTTWRARPPGRNIVVFPIASDRMMIEIPE